MSAIDNLSPPQFYHGTTAKLSVGDHITVGHDKNMLQPGKSTQTYFADTHSSASKYADYVAKESGGSAHVYSVEPTGGYRRAGGRVKGGEWTESEYASDHSLRVTGEV
jgi:rifampin ADP-ribosylating transferase